MGERYPVSDCGSEQHHTLGGRGIALVELVLALPVLVILLIGLINLGIAIAQYHNLQRAVYEAANYASGVPGLSSTNGRARVASFLGNLIALPDQETHVSSAVPPTPNIAYVGPLGGGGLPSSSVVVSLSGQMQIFLGEHVHFSATSISPYFLEAGSTVSNYQTFELPSSLVDCNRQSMGCGARGCGRSTPCP